MNERIIGIVGGAGPYAGLDLCQKILEETVADVDQDHVTVLNWSQPNLILDRTEYLMGQVDENPAGAIAKQVMQLAQAGATVAAIPCNTAHAPPIYDQIVAILQQAQTPIQFLHMIRETAVYLQTNTPHIKKIGVLSTTGTYRLKLYPHNLEPAGFTVLVPDEVMQTTRIHPAIYDRTYGIKANGVATQQARQNFLMGAKALQEAGAEALILGCTEIPLAIGETAVYDMLVVDPTRILARALIREVNPSRLKS
ncbi:MAG: aspartate/glutamate racemase family protein [Chloroflexi bacterium]|nr:aspartate/glutamate racemase family protein [Chloroflexota bacterium]